MNENATGGKIHCINAGGFQADVLIANRFIYGKSDILASNDADYVMHIGKERIQIKDFIYENRTKITFSMTLMFSSNDNANSWLQNLNIDMPLPM